MDVYVDGCLGFVLLTTALVTALAAWVRLDLERFSIYSNPSAEAFHGAVNLGSCAAILGVWVAFQLWFVRRACKASAAAEAVLQMHKGVGAADQWRGQALLGLV